MLYPSWQIKFKLEKISANTKTAQIEVFDILGKTVYGTEVETTNSTLDTELNLEYISNGTYVIKIKTDDRSYKARSIIINK